MAVYKAKAKFELPKPKPVTIFYDNGEIFSSEQGRASDAPKIGVACILEEETIHHKADFYIQTLQGFICCDTYGLIDYVTNNLNRIITVLAGRSMPNSQFWEIYEQAKQCRKDG
ncbi:MAG: hypothetical protein JAY90_18515 [Candidatus Thiodiazotropha lotti]|nr:hypothetical protein [Candidatus Thiodiazotropha lotti]